MRLVAIALVLLATGCDPSSPAGATNVAGPPAADLERAFQVAWEDAGHMEATARPHVRWVDDSGCTSPGVGGAVVTVPGACFELEVERDENTVVVAWHDGERISDSPFVSALALWKMWLETSSFEPIATQRAYEGEMRAALINAGL